MSDFFAALAARVVHRPGDGAAEAVRPRLPAMFETPQPDAAAYWGEHAEEIAIAPPVVGAAPLDPAPAAPIPARVPAPPETPRIASVIPDRPAARVAPSLPTRTAPERPVPAPATPARPAVPDAAAVRGADRPASQAGPIAATPTSRSAVIRKAEAGSTSSTVVVQTVPSLQRPLPAAPDHPVVAARIGAPPPPPAPPVPRVARAAEPRAIASPPSVPPETTIQVTIGRVDVRATAVSPEQRPAATTSPVMSLEEYLQSRAGRAGR